MSVLQTFGSWEPKSSPKNKKKRFLSINTLKLNIYFDGVPFSFACWECNLKLEEFKAPNGL